MDGSVKLDVVRYTAGAEHVSTDEVVAESPIEFRLGGVPIAVLMRTPGHDDELGRGFALTEAIVLGPHELDAVNVRSETDQGDRYDLVLAAGVIVDPEQFRRNLYTTSSCGVCGKASIDAVRIAAAPLPSGPVVAPSLLLGLPSLMEAGQSGFRRTGGLHAAAVFSSAGVLQVLREDIGRHNAVDKAIGALAAEGWPLGEVILLVSGRVSFEMVQKAAVAGIPMVCGVSAASSLAVELANELGATVIGFLRPEGFNVYSGWTRIG